jgi:hypothetical protein
MQYSLPIAAAGYQPPQNFRAWALVAGYRTVTLWSPVTTLNPSDPHVQTAYDIYDMDRDTTPDPYEQDYWNLDGDTRVSDDERDEDGDGLVNYHETNGPMTAGWWTACYSAEGEYPIKYAGTKAFDADSDGDNILDGADDQDFDDVPNIMELSRSMAGDVAQQAGCGGTATHNPAFPPTTWVNPFNPCLPDALSRTCQRHPVMSASYAPFKTGWAPLVLN